MADPEHLAILEKGVDVWNQWRGENGDIAPDLHRAYLRGADLSRANLSGANLTDANLTDANLSAAMPYFEQALVIYGEALGESHPYTARSLNNLGTLLQAMGDLPAARPYLEQAVAILERSLGPNHPNTQTARRNLQTLLDELATAAPAGESSA